MENKMISSIQGFKTNNYSVSPKQIPRKIQTSQNISFKAGFERLGAGGINISDKKAQKIILNCGWMNDERLSELMERLKNSENDIVLSCNIDRYGIFKRRLKAQFACTKPLEHFTGKFHQEWWESAWDFLVRMLKQFDSNAIQPAIPILNKLQNYTIKEYNNLSEQELQILRRSYEIISTEESRNHEEMHTDTSALIRCICDKKYGEDGYVAITIGRSLSSIGKCLGYQIGEDRVINIPLTGAGNYRNKEYVEKEKQNGGLTVLNEYLKSVGLNKEEIEKSDKKYVIMDYCFTGDSLKGAKALLTRDDVLGDKNIDSLDIIYEVRQVCANTFGKELKEYMRDEIIKDLSFVEQAFDLREVPNAIVDTTKCSIENRLLRFKILDNIVTIMSRYK